MPIRIRRLLAGLIDYAIGMWGAGITVLIVTLGKAPTNAFTVITFFGVVISYGLFKDCIFKNASIAKKWLHIYIANADNSPVTLEDIFKRNITLVLFPIELFLLLTEGERLGDRFSYTDVKVLP